MGAVRRRYRGGHHYRALAAIAAGETPSAESEIIEALLEWKYVELVADAAGKLRLVATKLGLDCHRTWSELSDQY